MATPFHLAPERPADDGLVEGLIARAFGPGRFAKAAERLREGHTPVAALSFVAWARGEAIGCVRLWPIEVGGADALLLGPFAVEEDWRSAGVGAALIRRACAAATAAGHRLILLVGDEAYFAPFGFSAAPARGVTMPGPADQRRVLVRALAQAAQGLAGPVRAVDAAPARARAAA